MSDCEHESMTGHADMNYLCDDCGMYDFEIENEKLVEQLHQRITELEQQLAAMTAERDAAVERIRALEYAVLKSHLQYTGANNYCCICGGNSWSDEEKKWTNKPTHYDGCVVLTIEQARKELENDQNEI